jgi:hypothetical protein
LVEDAAAGCGLAFFLDFLVDFLEPDLLPDFAVSTPALGVSPPLSG